jgi:hypothetical protein
LIQGFVEGAMAHLPSWKDLGAEFQKYAGQYADHAERESPEEWEQLPRGPWTLYGGSPRSHRLFKEIAARAAAKRGLSCHTDDTEPWQLWLNLMWTEGWHHPDAGKSGLAATRPRQVSWHQYKIEAENEGRERIERIFQTSADCCAEFEDRETDQSESLAAEAPVMNGGVSPEPLEPYEQKIDPAQEHERKIDPPLVRDRYVLPAGRLHYGGSETRMGPHVESKTPSSEERADIADRATKRQMVVNPILKKKRWKPGRLVTESGLGKATVYGYLDGTRRWIIQENRKAMADALGIATETLPE